VLFALRCVFLEVSFAPSVRLAGLYRGRARCLLIRVLVRVGLDAFKLEKKSC